MKMKALLFSMFLLVGTTAAFASTNVNVKEIMKIDKAKLIQVSAIKKGNKDFNSSCTVTISWTNADRSKGTATATITNCTCSAQTACDLAYKAASIMVPQK